MGLIENFERRLERFVNGAFSKAFKSQIQPVEISSAIKSKMDAGAAVVDRDRILAPNTFTVKLSQADYARLRSMSEHLVSEVKKQLMAHAKKQRYQLGGELSIEVEALGSLAMGQLQVEAASTIALVESVSWAPALDFGGKRYLLAKTRTTVGRDASADIQVNDTGLSRVHFAINWDGSNAMLEDLGSTNGTKLSGRAVSNQSLPADSTIEAGRTVFVFRVVAKTAGASE